MKPDPLQKLLASARKAQQPAPAPKPAGPPLGFATRVAAEWRALQDTPPRADLWERCCWWGAGASAAICLTVAAHHAQQPEPDALDVAFTTKVEASGSN